MVSSVSVLTGFGWSTVFIIWEQEKKNTTKEISGKWFSPHLNPVHLRKFSESVDRFQNVFTGIALATLDNLQHKLIKAFSKRRELK